MNMRISKLVKGNLYGWFEVVAYGQEPEENVCLKQEIHCLNIDAVFLLRH
jgi:hypothetical protein